MADAYYENHSKGTLPSSSKGIFIRYAIKYTDNRLDGHVSVDDIAGHISMSKYHFCREFKNVTGKLPAEYNPHRKTTRLLFNFKIANRQSLKTKEAVKTSKNVFTAF